MIEEDNRIEIEVLVTLGEYLKGSRIRVLADAKGTPLSRYWRQRLADAERDNCCRVVPKTKSTPTVTKRVRKSSRKKVTADKASISLESDANNRK